MIVGEQRESAQISEAREREKLLAGRKTELEKLQDQVRTTNMFIICDLGPISQKLT